MIMATAEIIERGGDVERGGSAVDQARAISQLPPSLAILKMENENIMSLAAARPRNMMEIKQELSETLAAFPELAAEAIYNKPVGTVSLITCHCGSEYEATSNKKEDMTCPRCKKIDVRSERRVQKYARGLSIKAAETLAEAYGFNRVRADVSDIDDNKVKVEVTFTDYQRGRIWQDSGIVSKWYKGRGGSMTKTDDSRFYNVTLKAEKSKYIREAITRSVNPGLKAWFWDQCDKIQDELLDDVTVEKIITQFSGKNVSPQMLEWLVGRPKSAGWTKDDRKNLVGIWTALKDGETTVNDLFSDFFGADAGNAVIQPESAKGPVTWSSLTNPKSSPVKSVETTPPPAKTEKAKLAVDRTSDLEAKIKAAASSKELEKLIETIADAHRREQISDDELTKLVELGDMRHAELTANGGE